MDKHKKILKQLFIWWWDKDTEVTRWNQVDKKTKSYSLKVYIYWYLKNN